MKISFIVILMIILSKVSGQEHHEITAKITDSLSGKPLEFVQVSLLHSSTGTNTNDEGFFRLLPGQYNPEDTLVIFSLGYSVCYITVRGITELNNMIALRPITLRLEEVEVVGLTPEEVIRKAVATIPINYGKDPLILTAFIRSQKLVNNKMAEFAEAIVEDNKTGYYLYKKGDVRGKHLTSNITSLIKGRVISDTNLVNVAGDAGRQAGCLGCNFTNDIVEFYHNTILDERLFRFYDLSMEELIQPGNGKIYHIRYLQKKGVNQKLWAGDLYIDAASFAVMKISQKPSMNAYQTYEKGKYDRDFTLLGKPGWIEEMPFITQSITYSKKDTIWHLSAIRTETWTTFAFPPTGQRFKFAYKNDVVITDVTRDKDKLTNFKGDRLTGVSRRWDQIIGRPDDAFWADYNYLPVEERLRKSIEAIGK